MFASLAVTCSWLVALSSKVCGVAVTLPITGATLAAAMTMLKGLVAVTLLASLARTVKLLVPAVVGVPLRTPVAVFSVIPAGSVPTLMLQV